MRARIHRGPRRRRRVVHALAIGLGMAAQLVRRWGFRRRRVIPVARVRHSQREVDEVVVVDVVVPLVSPVVVAGAAALVSAGGVPGKVLVDVVVVVEVLSLVVDVDVGVVDVVVVVEPGVALAPELLYEVLAPLLQPGRAAVAMARTAM